MCPYFFFHKSGGGNTYFGSNQFFLNTWVHIAFTFAPPNLITLYINGSASYFQSITPTNATACFHLGSRCSYSFPNRTLNGLVDNLRIWGRTLTSMEISQDMNDQIPNGCNLLGAWDGGGSSNVLTDLMGINNGTLSGAVAIYPNFLPQCNLSTPISCPTPAPTPTTDFEN